MAASLVGVVLASQKKTKLAMYIHTYKLSLSYTLESFKTAVHSDIMKCFSYKGGQCSIVCVLRHLKQGLVWDI